MITTKPKAENYSPIFVEDIITSNDNNDVYCIENTSNRPYRWDTFITKRDGLDEINNLFKLNILDVKKRGKHYLSFGRTGVSGIDDISKENYQSFDRDIKSIIEGGHRIKIPFCSYIALTLLKYQKENRLNEKIDDIIFYNEFQERKMDYIGKTEFTEIYDFIKNNTVKEIIKVIKKSKSETNSLFKSTKYRKTVFNVIVFCYNYFKDMLEKDSVYEDVDIDFLINLLLKNVYYREEYVSRDNKWQYFDNCNTKGLIVDLTDKIPRAIASKFNGLDRQRVIDGFEKMYDLAFKTQKAEKYIPTKNNSDCCEFVLDLAYKMFLLKETKTEIITNPQEIILDNPKHGVMVGFEKYGFCSTVEKAIEFFNVCYDICDFIYHSMDNNVDIYDTYFMFKKEDGCKNVVWWYDVLPLYVMNTYIHDKSVKKYFYDYMCKMKAFQYSYKTVGRTTNTQNYISLMFKITKIIFEHINNEKEIVNVLKNEFSKLWLGKCLKQRLKSGLRGYRMDFEPVDIKRVLIWNEYIFISKFGVNHDTLYRFMVDKQFNADLDHIIPKKRYNEIIKSEEGVDCSPVGEMVLLESSLNRSKGDKMEKNSTIYSNSGFYLTSFLLSSTKKGLKSETINLIDFERYTEETLNNFNAFDVDKRTLYLIDNYVDWIYDI